MSVFAIIPARGGSKRISKKNIKLLGGKPLVAYTIEAALKSGIVDEVYVSTDDNDIAEVSKRYRAKIIPRPKEISGDGASSESALFHAVEYLERKGKRVDIIVFLQCTSPFRKAWVIRECVNKLKNKKYDSVLSVYRDFRYYGRLKDGKYIPFREKREPRQKMSPYYCDNGAVYVLTKKTLYKYKNRYGGRIGVVEMPEEDSHDIDTPFEFWLAEQMIEKRK